VSNRVNKLRRIYFFRWIAKRILCW